MENLAFEQVPIFLGIVFGAVALCFLVAMIYEYRAEVIAIVRWLFTRYVELRQGQEAPELPGSGAGSEPEPGASSGGAMRQNRAEPAGSAGSGSAEIYAVLARLIADTNRRPLPGGKLSATRALTSGLGLTKGSGREYVDAKVRLDAELDRLKGADGPQFRELDDERRPTGEVIAR